MLYRRLIINGTEYMLAVSQSGSGAPKETTEGAAGVLYMDTDDGSLYKCTGEADGKYTWEPMETGNGPGQNGEDGGYYTPDVTQPTDDTMQVAFTPSKAGMPAVQPATVKLPVGSGSDSSPDVELDTTLTQSGKAADAKAVGDKIAEITGISLIEPADDDIPVVHFIVDGGMPFTKDEGDVQVLMRYISKTATIERYCTAKVQGSSSASNSSYKKRNWTIKVYKDNTYEDKEKLSFKGWPAMNKFVLKAGWVIPGHLRNVGAAKIWGQIMRSRSDYDTLPEELRNSPNQGATDGFHVRVFVNGMYWGIYDWIVAKDQLFGQDKDNTAHSILNSELNNQPTCAFATTSPTISGNWSEELQDDMTADTKTSMENWIKFVAGSTDEEFVANAENYFDVQSVIDAICFDRIIMTVDNMCRNQIVFKYDTKWYMGKWDLDAILGLPPVSGQTWYTYDTAYQEGYVAYKDYGIINMLYDRTEKLYLPRFKENYWRLRNGPLSESNLVEVFGRMSDRLRSIDGLLAEENASTTGNGQFTGMPNVGKDTIQQIREFVVKRCAYMDAVVSEIPATSITLSATTLHFDTKESQTLTATVEPPDATDPVVWVSSDNNIATVADGVVTPVSNGAVVITATAGNVSAECVVNVEYLEIPCTSIVLSDSTLTFNSRETQTLTATVTPINTTDVVQWESSDTSVVTVSNGVVEVVGDGNATIRAICGEHTATCTVSVSGVGANILHGVNISYGLLNNNDGTEINSAVFIRTDYFDVSAYAGKKLYCNAENTDSTESTWRVIFYDANKAFAASVHEISAHNCIVVPATAVYARVSCGIEGMRFAMYEITDDNNALIGIDAIVGKRHNQDTGKLVVTNGYCTRKIDVVGGQTLHVFSIASGAFYDANETFVSGIPFSGDSCRIIEIPENAVTVGLNYLDTNETGIYATCQGLSLKEIASLSLDGY